MGGGISRSGCLRVEEGQRRHGIRQSIQILQFPSELSNTKSGMQLIRAVPYRSSYPGGSGVAHPKQTSVNQSIIRR